MPYSHHSHSGQFCAHAKDKLEDLVKTAISRGMSVYALTEHMYRDLADRYPEEELDIPDMETFYKITGDFYAEAQRLKLTYKNEIELLVGFESEWIRPSSLGLIKKMQTDYQWDIFVGSVHHVHRIPIDYDRTLYERGRAAAGGTDEALFGDYFDSQYEMLQATKPPVVGHLDVIRLLSDNPNKGMHEYNGVSEKVLRNLRFIKSYDGVLEINTSALRKGLEEPYPGLAICKAFVELGGSFCLSDDAHGVDQVGTNYHKLLPFFQAAGIDELRVFRPLDAGIPGHEPSSCVVSSLEGHNIFTLQESVPK